LAYRAEKTLKETSPLPLRPLNIGSVSVIRRGGLIALSLFFLICVACGGGNGKNNEVPAGGTVGLDDSSDEGVFLQTSVKTDYYSVEGASTEAIFRFIEQNGPTDGQGKRGSGLTSVVWAYDWKGSRENDGSCSIASMTIHADMSVLLPRHANEAGLSPEILQHWRDYAAGVAKHEQRHVDIYTTGANDIKDEMSSIGKVDNCDELENRIESIWADEQARINGLQQAFHNEEGQRLAAARAPIEAQINANRVRLDSLQSQIADLDKQISGLKSEISTLDVQIDNVETQIKQITDQFPGTLPDTVKSRLEALVIQRNELLVAYNGRVEAHNTALSSRATLAAQYEPLVAETNDLVDQFNWSR
jgi:predicted secreted Zn-dependent protease